MDSLKDILAQVKKEQEKEDSSLQQDQPTLFDMSTIKDNPKKMLGDKHKYISKEYQIYGLRLAGKLGDKERATMYIKWAKEKNRAILDSALSFTADYPNAKNKAKIFMWKVKELEREYNAKREDKEKNKKKIKK